MKRKCFGMILAVCLCLALTFYGWCEQKDSVARPVLQRTTVPVQDKTKVASIQPQALEPRIDIIEPAEGTILEEGNTYKIEWTTFAIPQGSGGSIEFNCPPYQGSSGNPQGSLVYSMWCIHNMRTLASNPPLNGSINFTMHKVEHPLYHSGDIVDYEIRVSFTTKANNKSYECIKKIKVRIK